MDFYRNSPVVPVNFKFADRIPFGAVDGLLVVNGRDSRNSSEFCKRNNKTSFGFLEIIIVFIGMKTHLKVDVHPVAAPHQFSALLGKTTITR